MSGCASAGSALQRAAVAALTADPALAGVAVFDAAPVRAGLPYVQVDEPVLVDWGAKGWSGREGSLAVLARDAGERPVRLRVLVGGIEDALATLAPELGDGWRLAGIRLARSRIVRAGGDRWLATVEMRARVYRED